eukprot:CAMPEP_0170191196 /NCGR_PEP_ID=MMETSP0040_2-20121228/51101_1 /TAXON_ID=641309 /ORGANISM="Lotharella oceanica, Strain CCMP622" /LENGTH=99 /DNA_ID=CAMNT_0010439221 /DNA_START=538 /DNA_END=834 /DNA_ORIENTATION=-
MTQVHQIVDGIGPVHDFVVAVLVVVVVVVLVVAIVDGVVFDDGFVELAVAVVDSVLVAVVVHFVVDTATGAAGLADVAVGGHFVGLGNQILWWTIQGHQ